MEQLDFVIDDDAPTLEMPLPPEVTGWENVIFVVRDDDSE
jgi:hypothetical protein